jgi:gentisate 1,2-dioxygenase
MLAILHSLGPSNPPHHRSGAALYYIIAGTGANTVAAKTEAKGPGSLVYEPFGVVHQWGNGDALRAAHASRIFPSGSDINRFGAWGCQIVSFVHPLAAQLDARQLDKTRKPLDRLSTEGNR